MKTHSRTQVIISLDAIAHNFCEMREKLADDTKMLAVLKADGSGHGAVKIAQMIQDYPYLWGMAAATAEEALIFRNHNIQKPILILGHVFPEDYEELIQKEIRMTISDYDGALAISKAAEKMKKDAYLHLAVDTGMSRIGFACREESIPEIQKISQLPYIKIEGLFTHFARADEYDRTPALVQLKRYQTFADWIAKEGVEIPMHHCSNSAGIMRVPESHMDMVRAGITIYGIYPSDEVEKDVLALQPALEWKSAVSFVKEIEIGAEVSYGGIYKAETRRKVATIPVGYADGYPRSLSNKGQVLIAGKRAKILGRVCMDQFMVDVTELPPVTVGTEVTLIGTDGTEEITVQELGDLSGRFPYEFVCEINKRVPRVYRQNGQIVE